LAELAALLCDLRGESITATSAVIDAVPAQKWGYPAHHRSRSTMRSNVQPNPGGLLHPECR
jgi:hypothetical protein